MDYKSKSKKELMELCKEKRLNISDKITKIKLIDILTNPCDINLKNNKGNLELVKELLKIYSIKDISKKLNLATGTIKRWIELKNVPTSYTFDLLRLLSIKIDYTQYSFKEKDQIFTPLHTAQYCYETFTKKMEELGENIEDYHYIEPSAGDGSFMKVLPINKTIGMDIEPRGDNIEENDFLNWVPTIKQKYIVFGNPPFGLRGHLALKFINHSYNFSDYVCFILPQLFESDGKGSPSKEKSNWL